MDNEKKTAVVTGASRGIGRAIAKKLASDGYNVIVNYSGSKEKADAVVAEIIADGGLAIAYKCDVSDSKECLEMINDIKAQYGSVDVLVNNAGITRDGLIMRMSEEDFDAVINVNLKGCFNAIKAVTPIMLKQRSGKIINMSSVVGITGNMGQANYSASKAGVIGLTKSAAKELASRGITVNAIAPGFIETDMTSVLKDNIKEAMKTMIPLPRFGQPEDIANAVSFLASDSASYITGQVLNVDGGMVM